MAESGNNELINSEEQELLKAKSDALRLLSFSARSADELRARLKRKKYTDALINRVIEGFQKQGLIDDAKFAKLFAESRVYSRPTGKRQLEMDLKKKGLAPELVRQTIADLKDYDEKGMVRELARKRLKGMTGVSKEKKRARLFGFLKRRGFGSEAIFSVMDELFSAKGGSASGGKGGSAEDLELKEHSSED